MIEITVIKQMDERLANMIAAGEVVDRPASVIKELIENSIDAEATEINIFVKDHGMTMIKVSDNGVGMSKEDAKMAFLRHATSKVINEFDLERINTLGFRGEALAAILSVSRLHIATRMKDSNGHFLSYEDSKLINEGLASLNIGTEITVSDLFYNTPARFKYIKSEYAERAHIIDTFDRLALANPHIRFSLMIDDVIVKQTFGNNDYYSLIKQIYGTNVLKDLKFFENNFQKINVKGYLINPHISRARKKDISIFINGRYIRNYSLTQAVVDGYHTYLMTNRYPIAIIHLEMDPVLLDVNVHPQKLEVKFVNESIIKYHIELFIKETLEQSVHDIPQNITMVKKYNDEDNTTERYVKEELDFIYGKTNINSEISEGYLSEEYVPVKKLPDFSYVGVVAATYLIFQNSNGMYMVDQHAAEERIRYEYYANLAKKPEIISKQMLLSRPLELSSSELANLEENIDAFNAIGFTFNKRLELTAHPTFILDNNLDIAIDSMLAMIDEKGLIEVSVLLDDLAKDKSCKAAIKANKALSRLEVDQLMIDLRKTTNPYTCPHGRPVLIHLTHYEIERMFKRVVS